LHGAHKVLKLILKVHVTEVTEVIFVNQPRKKRFGLNIIWGLKFSMGPKAIRS